MAPSPFSNALSLAMNQHGRSLGDLSDQAPLLVVFLRHTGCTFCREALADIAAARARIEASGCRIVLVHMATREHASALLARYGLEHVDQISDPQRHLYRAFELRRGSLLQLFGPFVVWRGFVAGLLKRHGVGRLAGDGFQMPGAFIVHRRRIVRSFRHATAADRPDYPGLACALPQSSTDRAATAVSG